MPQPSAGRTTVRSLPLPDPEAWGRRLARLGPVWRNRRAALGLLDELHVASSQYGEDVIFDRLLRPGPEGTYVDVGSHNPIAGSNTYKLYLRGWSGLTVDPNQRFAEASRQLRPRDVHLREGVSLEREELTYHEFDQDQYNTFVEAQAERVVAAGQPIRARRTVVCRPLGEMVDQHLAGRPIDLLSVDCEGLDLTVLRSLDLRAHRPTVIIVEDFDSLPHLQGRRPPSALATFLHDEGYTPIAQSAWARILVADDWPDLFARSGAYAAERVQDGYLPGRSAP